MTAPSPTLAQAGTDVPADATLAAVPPAADTAPRALPERLPLVDTVRGFALLGVCLVNYTMFAQPLEHSSPGARPVNGPWDLWVERAMHVLAEGKFYPLFSLLFGLGLLLQSERAGAEGRRVGGRFARRLGVLVVLGAVHGFLVWSGDILLTYALLGFALLLFQDVSTKWLKRWAGLSVSLTVAALLGFGLLFAVLRTLAEGAPELQQGLDAQVQEAAKASARAVEAYTHGGYADVLRHRLREFPQTLMASAFTVWPLIFGMFLVGLWVGRTGLLHRPEAHRPFLRRALVGFGVPGLAASVVGLLLHDGSGAGLPTLRMMVAMVFHLVGGAALGFAYLCGLVLLLQRDAWARRLGPLTAVGRMSVTNYLTQSLVGGLLFYGYGLGLYGKVGAGAALALALPLFALQVAFSNWWMARFRMGPVEWAWRSLALWQRQPLRRAAAA